jgi:hypothetical protein
MIDHMKEPMADGTHPDYPHLILAEVEQHYGMLILTFPGVDGDALISLEDWDAMVGDVEQADREFAYVSNEYLEILTKE